MEEISISTEGDNDISQLFVKKKKRKKKKKEKEEENCWLIMSGPWDDNYLHTIRRRCNSEDTTRS